MSASLVQSSGKQTANYTDPTYALTGVTVGNTILVLINYIDDDANSTQPSGVADGYGSYTQDKVQIGNNTGGNHSSSSVYSSFNAAAGSHTITITRGGGSTAVYFVYEVLEVAGLPTTNSLGPASATSYGSSTGPLTVTSGTLSAAGGFAVALCENAGATNAPSTPVPTGFTGLFVSAGSDYPSGAAVYQVPGSTAALTANFGTITANAWAVVLAYYTAAPVATVVWWT